VNYLINHILAYPKTVLGIFLVCVGALGWQAQHFEIDASAETLLTKNNELYIQTRVMDERFSPQEFLLIGYKPKNHPVLSEKTFNDLRALSAELEELDRVESVRSIINVPFFLLMDNGLSSGQDASEWTLEKKNFSITELQEALLNHPIYEELLINREQTATAIQVLFKTDKELADIQTQITRLQENMLHGRLSDKDEETIEKLQALAEPIQEQLDNIRIDEIQEIRQLISTYEDDAEIYLGGVHVLGFQLIQIIKNDLIVFGGLIAGIICLIIFLLFRKPRWVAITIICCACSVLATMGLLGILGIKTTVISSSFVALQLILTLAIVIHLIVQYREYSSAHPDWNQLELVRQTFLRKVKPCLYAGITTAIGFASLLFTDIQPVISFGWMMIIAMLFSLGVSLILFPALLAILPREPAATHPRLIHGILKIITPVVQKRGTIILVSSALILVSAGTGLFRLDVENSFLNYFRDSTQVYKELSFIDRELGGSTPLDLIYTIPDAQKDKNLILTADTVQQLQRIQAALSQYEAVGKQLSIVNFTELAKKINDNKPLTEYELTVIYKTIENTLRKDLLGSFLSPEHSQIRISIRIQDTTENLDRTKLIADIKQDMQELGIPEEQYVLTSLFVLYQDILQRLFRSQLISFGFVYITLTLTFFAIFRSIRIALIGIAANIFSVLVVLGVMGWLKIPLDLMTITIASIAMGIAVDDAIHYIQRYLEEIEEVPSDEAIANTHFSVGYAMIYTSLIIIIGFSLLAFSDFMPSVLFGLLTGLAMAIALLANLLMLPVLLKNFVTAEQKK
jgi:hypothetical protein